MSPLGRRRAGADGPGGSRKACSSRERIQASPTGVRTSVSDERRASNAAWRLGASDTSPGAERLGCRRAEDVDVAAGELAPRLVRLDSSAAPSRSPRPPPSAQQQGPGRRRVLDRVATPSSCWTSLSFSRRPARWAWMREPCPPLFTAMRCSQDSLPSVRRAVAAHHVDAVARPRRPGRATVLRLAGCAPPPRGSGEDCRPARCPSAPPRPPRAGSAHRSGAARRARRRGGGRRDWARASSSGHVGIRPQTIRAPGVGSPYVRFETRPT